MRVVLDLVRKGAGVMAAVVALSHGALFAQGSPSTPDFSRFEVIFYGSTTGRSPDNVLALDNNGAIVLGAVRGTTLEALRARVPFNDSQLALLSDWRLVAVSRDTLRTAFPVLDTAETAWLRRLTRAAAQPISEQILNPVTNLVAELRASRRADNAYSILFSYVLDGLTWDHFKAEGLLPQHTMSADTPFWSGVVWALSPKRAFAPGTNVISEAGVSLHVTWSHASIPLMRPFVADFPNLLRLFADYRTRGRAEPGPARSIFEPFGLFDTQGTFTIPHIDECSRNVLYELASSIASQIAATVPTALNLDAVASRLGLDRRSDALVIGYHELMWDILDDLESRGVITKPKALTGSTAAKPADVSALVFTVHGPSGNGCAADTTARE